MITFNATVALGSADRETGRELHTFKIEATDMDSAWALAEEELGDEEGEVLSVGYRRA